MAAPTPLAQYKLNDNAANTTILEEVGIIGNGALTGAGNTNASSVAGKINTAITLDGTNDYIYVSYDTHLNFAGSYSLSMWVYLNTVNAAQEFWRRQISSGANPNMFFEIQADNTVRFYTHDGTNSFQCVTTDTLSVYTWYHLVCVSDTVGQTAKIYINGVEKKSVANTTGSFNASTQPGAFGVSYPDSNAWLGGRLDDVRIYTTALTVNDVLALYNNGMGTEALNPSYLLNTGYSFFM